MIDIHRAQNCEGVMLADADRNLKIAVVDDQSNIANLYSKVIEKLGYPSPSIFSDGTSMVMALTKDRQSFDIIIMDYQMPEMNGIEAAKIILRYKKDTKIILATASPSVEQEALVMGIPILSKPFSSEQLSKSLKRNFSSSL
jgi:CheY-like chemotaxis protein